MRHIECRRLVVLATSSLAVLGSAGVAAAACPPRPLPPCGTAGFTGKEAVSASRCVRPPPACVDRGRHGARGHRGLRGLTGRTGADGQAGSDGTQGEQGNTGTQGEQGLQGDAGVQGEQGNTGAQGLQGVQGNTGAPGAQGQTGSTGAAGPTGAQGAVGPSGPQGPAGAGGQQGPPGSTGPTGASGTNGTNGTNGLSEYAYILNRGAQVVPIEADVAFDENGVITPGITHAPGTTQIAVTAPGDYKVSFSVSGVEPSQFALFLNGSPVTDSVYGSGAGTQETAGQAIITLAAGDVLTLRNHSSSAAVTLQTLAGGTQANVNASVVLERLGS